MFIPNIRSLEMSSRHKEAGSLRHMAISPLFHKECQTLTIDGLIELSCTSVVAEKSIPIPVETQLNLSGWENKTQTSLFTGLTSWAPKYLWYLTLHLAELDLLRISYHNKGKECACIIQGDLLEWLIQHGWMGAVVADTTAQQIKQFSTQAWCLPRLLFIRTFSPREVAACTEDRSFLTNHCPTCPSFLETCPQTERVCFFSLRYLWMW